MSKNRIELQALDKAEIIEVIHTKGIRGEGTEKDPVRPVDQYWDFEGNLLGEVDEWPIFKDHHCG